MNKFTCLPQCISQREVSCMNYSQYLEIFFGAVTLFGIWPVADHCLVATPQRRADQLNYRIYSQVWHLVVEELFL